MINFEKANVLGLGYLNLFQIIMSYRRMIVYFKFVNNNLPLRLIFFSSSSSAVKYLNVNIYLLLIRAWLF